MAPETANGWASNVERVCPPRRRAYDPTQATSSHSELPPPQTGAGPAAETSIAGKGKNLKTSAPASYRPMFLAMRAAEYGAALAQIYPNRPPPTIEQLMAKAAAHQTGMARAARELKASRANAHAARIKRLRDLESSIAGLVPTSSKGL